MLKTRYFHCKELVQPEMIDICGEEMCMAKFDFLILENLDFLRYDYEREIKKLGLYEEPKDAHIIINGLWKGDIYKYSGARSLDCKIGAFKSKHKEWKAFDLKCNFIDVLIGLIFKKHKFYRINRMENPEITKTWVHIEFGISETLKVFNP